MESPSTLFLLADRVLNGTLEHHLRIWARAGVSRRAAARLLAHALGGIEIAPETVRKWMDAARQANEAA